MAEIIRFDRFRLDPANRQLRRDGAPVAISARYLDALVLLAGEPGGLVTKERLLSEVWRGVPVTDEALTQCIRALRRALGDDAAHPRFIETVPKHGYRFVAAVREEEMPASMDSRATWPAPVLVGGAGVIGGGTGGALCGLIYGLAGAAPPGASAMSALIVLLCLSILAALIGAAGIMAGIAVTLRAGVRAWAIVGGAVGGLALGAVARLIGLDAFSLLLGQAPRDITGASEGALLGAATGLALWLAAARSVPKALAIGAVSGALAGAIIALTGGEMFGASVDQLARQFAGSRIGLDRFAALVGESAFGPRARLLGGLIEGGLFVGGMAGAARLAIRQIAER